MRLKALIFFGIFSLVSFGFSDMMDFQLHQLPYQLHTKEELLPLYAQWLYPNKDSIGRNIKWLELAYIAYFDDPIKALVPIKSEIQYKRYQNLLMMHICVLLTQEYINYGYQFFKENVYYYNTGYLDEYLKGFRHRRILFHAGGPVLEDSGGLCTESRCDQGRNGESELRDL